VPDEMREFARAAREFLDAHSARRGNAEFRWGEGDDTVAYFRDDPPDVTERRLRAAKDWQRARYENGFAWISGPVEYGGRGLSPAYETAYAGIESEYDVPDTGTLSIVGLGMIGPTILAHGQQAAKDRYLPAMYRGDVIACQLFSEPGAGSDLAGLSTRAVPDGPDWILNGQKVWTSLAQHSQLGMALARTDVNAPKHKGITAFLVDLSLPGVDVRPLRQMTGGAEFNEVFLTDVRVPDDHRLGEVNDGWRVALTTLMNERATVGGARSGGVAESLTPDRLSALLRATGTEDDGALRRDLSELLADMFAARYLNHQAARRRRAGVPPGPEMSVAKYMHAQNLTRAAHFASRVLGPRIIADNGEWGTYAWTELLLATPALRILGGTEEIMKNILAERVLQLPKEPGIDTRSPFRELPRSGRPKPGNEA
jgi:alkylation response protein AidB-like acyl-CoA dehydrogenase